jgi:hypothetical protein
MTQAPEPPSVHVAVPHALEAVIMRCLAKAPEQRYASATELAEALRAAALDDAWSDDAATAWWQTAKVASAPAPDAPTRTITIDLKRAS